MRDGAFITNSLFTKKKKKKFEYKRNKSRRKRCAETKKKTSFFTQKFANFVDDDANKREGRRVKMRKVCVCVCEYKEDHGKNQTDFQF